MKFCKYCGKQLQDNEVCTCQGAVAEQPVVQPVDYQPSTQPVQTPVQPVDYQPSTQPVQTPAQPVDYQPVAQQTASPYAVNTATKPAGDSAFVKALKNIPVAVKGYFTDSKAVISTAKKDKDIILASLFTAVLFLVSMISSCFVFYGNGLIRYLNVNFGLVFLFALVSTLASGVLYVLVKFGITMIFQKGTAPKDNIISSFIEFSFHSIPVAMIYLVGGLFGLFSFEMLIGLVVFAVLYYILVLVAGIKEDVTAPKNPALFNLLLTLFITIALAIVFFVISKVVEGMVLGAMGSFGSSLLGGLGSFSSLLG